MIRDLFGGGDEHDYCVRWDAYETQIDVVGNLTIKELDHLIATLQAARRDRKDEPEEQASNA